MHDAVDIATNAFEILNGRFYEDEKVQDMLKLLVGDDRLNHYRAIGM
jgi:hypothetical protein